MKVYNPNTKRYVIASGQTARKLYKEHLKGKQDLTESNVIVLSDVFKNMSLKRSKDTGQHKMQIQHDKYVLYLSDFQDIKPVSTQGTSRIFTGVHNGDKYYIKEVVKDVKGPRRTNHHGVYDVELATNEFLASLIYTDVYKVDAVRLFFVINDVNKKLQKYMVASKAILIDTCEPMTKDCNALIDNKIPGAIEPFLVDCILANWDVGSRGNVGIITSENKKKAFRIDVGGSLLYRAMGQKRHYGNVPEEHQTFLVPSNKGYKLFSSLKRAQIKRMFDIISKVEVNDFSSIKDNLHNCFTGISSLAKHDLTKIIRIFEVIPIVHERHQFYMNHREQVMTFILGKLKS